MEPYCMQQSWMGTTRQCPLGTKYAKKGSGVSWFLEKMYECIGDCQDLPFVADKVDSICIIIENVSQTLIMVCLLFIYLETQYTGLGKMIKQKSSFGGLCELTKLMYFKTCRLDLVRLRHKQRCTLQKFHVLNGLESIAC